MLYGQSFLGRHLQIFIGMPDGLYEQTLFRFTGHDGWPSLSALEQTFPRVEHKTAFDLIRLMAMTFMTILRKDWLDLLFVKLDLQWRKARAACICASGSKKNPSCGDHRPKPLARNYSAHLI